MTKQAFRYFPFQPELDSFPNIMTDSGRAASTVLELSHWPGNKTPLKFKADTSTEIVLKFLGSSEFEDYLSTVEWVSSDHYDVDGLLSVWVLTQGRRVLDDFDKLKDIATVGDFDKYVSDESLKSCLILYYFEQSILQKAIEKSNWATNEVTRFLYQSMFSIVEDSLHRQGKYTHFWEDKYRQVQNDRNTIQTGKVEVTEHLEYDLAIIRSNKELSDFAINERVTALKVLCIYDRHYVLRYRYESFVEMASMLAPYRLSLKPLAEQLNKIEKNGTWFCEDIVTAHPKLQLYTNSQVPGRSTIDEAVFVTRVLDYFQSMTNNFALQWHPSNGWQSSTEIPLPPSLLEYGV